MSVLCIIILLTQAGNIPHKIKSVWNYYHTKNLQSEFTQYDDIKNYPFKKGQYVELKNQFSIPNVHYYENFGYEYGSKTFISSKQDIQLPNLSHIYTYIEKLNALQETKEFITLFLYSLDTLEEYYYFLGNFISDTELPSIAEFRTAFNTNLSFNILEEAAYVLDTLTEDGSPEDPIPYSKGGYLKTYFNDTDEVLKLEYLINHVSNIYSQFLREQEAIVSEMFNQTMIEYMKGKDMYLLSTGENTVIEYELHSSDLAKVSRRSYSSVKPLYKNETLRAKSNLDTFVQEFSAAFKEEESIRGIIKNVSSTEQGYLSLEILKNEEYNSIDNFAADIFLFLSLLALMLYATYNILKVYLKPRQND